MHLSQHAYKAASCCLFYSSRAGRRESMFTKTRHFFRFWCRRELCQCSQEPGLLSYSRKILIFIQWACFSFTHLLWDFSLSSSKEEGVTGEGLLASFISEILKKKKGKGCSICVRKNQLQMVLKAVCTVWLQCIMSQIRKMSSFQSPSDLNRNCV